MGLFEPTVKPAGNGGFGPLPVPQPVSLATAASPRHSVDPHSIRHAKISKAALAVAGAEVLDGGLPLLNPTIAMVATGLGVSAAYIAAARQLSPEQRQEVLSGYRPLVRRRTPSPVPSVAQRFAAIVSELGGIAGARNELAALERNGNNNASIG